MPQPDEAKSAAAPSSFAGLLAALAAPASSAPARASAWLDDGLEDDVATLSYERALRTHARYRSADPGEAQLTQSPGPQASPASMPHSSQPYRDEWASISKPPICAEPDSAPSSHPAPALERNLKRASITIRMSNEECAQLHQRAAAAGLTVSAYLRSCTFEAESLRALVKDTLAQLKPNEPKKSRAVPAPARRAWFKWLSWILPPWRLHRGVARA